MKNYFPLIEFELSHTYFTNGNCKGLELSIAQNEKRLMNNFKLILKQIASWKYILYTELDVFFKDRIKILEREINEDPNYLSFILKVKEKQFYTITRNLLISPGNQLINIPVELKKSEADTIQFNIYDYQNNEPLIQLQQDLLNENPNILAHLTFNFSEKSNEYLLSRILSNKPVNILIKFQAKSVFWKYIFLPRTNKNDNVIISEAKQLIQFSDVEWIESENIGKSGISYSTNEIELSENYPYAIQLWKKYSNGKSLILNQLSFPNHENPANFSVDENEKNYISIYQYY